MLNRFPAVARRRLSRRLRDLREESRLTLVEVARRSGVPQSSVTRVERGEISPSGPVLAALLRVYGVSAVARHEMEELASVARKRDWWHQEFGGAVNQWFMKYLSLEPGAWAIKVLQGNVVPGLLQTESYASIVLASVDVPEDMMARRITLRMRRQSLILAGDAPRLHFLVDESAIRRLVGGASVMREQYAYLLELMQRANVELRIIPFGRGFYRASNKPFVILEFEGTSPVVYIEQHNGALYLEDDEQLEDHYQAFGEAGTLALTAEESRELVTEQLGSL